MVEDFLKQYANLIADYPNKISIEKKYLDDSFVELVIFADQVDVGKLIGKNGKMISAIKTVISAYKSKDNISYKVTVKAIE